MRAPLGGHGRAEDGPAGAVHPGRRHRRVRHQQHVDGVGPGARLRQGPRVGARRRRGRGPQLLVSRCRSTASCPTSATCSIPATRTTPVRIVTAEPRRPAEEGPVRRRRDPRSDEARRAGRADDGRALRRAEPSVRLRAGRAGQVRAAAGQARRPAGGRHADPRRPEGGRARRDAGQRVPAVRERLLSRRQQPHDRPHRLVRPVAAVHRHRGDDLPGGLGRRVVPEPADRRVPGPVAAARADRHAVAGPRRRGSRAPHHDPARSRDERHPEARRAALDLAVRPVVGHDELPVRHRPVLRAPAGVRAHRGRGRCRTA